MSTRIADLGFAIFVVTCIALVAGLIVAGIKAQPAGCAARWEPRETQYTPESGCRVEFNGAFVPEDNVRFGE